MVVNKRKKVSRQRGRHTHGWGSKKKHRGSGNRGGKGMAGTGKRADSIKTLIWKDVDYFGKHGFKFKGVKRKIDAISIDYIQGHLNKLVDQGLITQEGNIFVVDLSKLGYNKLLGNGTVKNKFKIITKYASSNAIEKVKKAGGEVVVEVKKEEEEESSE